MKRLPQKRGHVKRPGKTQAMAPIRRPSPEVIEAAEYLTGYLKVSEEVAPESPNLKKLWHSTCRVVTQAAEGTGFFVESKIVVTNAHVVDGHSIATIDRGLAGTSSAVLMAIDYPHDLAVLFTPAASTDTLTLGEYPSPGDDVWICGFPLSSKGRRLRRGCVSGYEEIVSYGFAMSGVVLDATIHQGNSGGAIVSAGTGEVVGVVTRIRSPLSVAPKRSRPISKVVGRVVSEIVDGLVATSGIAFGIDPVFVERMFEMTELTLERYRRGEGPEEIPEVCMTREEFIALQRAAAASKRPGKPASVVGVFSCDGENCYLGWSTEADRVALEAPHAWSDLARKHIRAPGGNFMLEGYRVLAYERRTGFVPCARLVLTA